MTVLRQPQAEWQCRGHLGRRGINDVIPRSYLDDASSENSVFLRFFAKTLALCGNTISLRPDD